MRDMRPDRAAALVRVPARLFAYLDLEPDLVEATVLPSRVVGRVLLS